MTADPSYYKRDDEGNIVNATPVWPTIVGLAVIVLIIGLLLWGCA